MIKTFINSLVEGKHGKTVKEFRKVKLSYDSRSDLSFIINEKNGRNHLFLVLTEDEGHEIEREYCELHPDFLDDIEELAKEVREHITNMR